MASIDIIMRFSQQFERHSHGEENTASEDYISLICASLQHNLEWFRNSQILDMCSSAAGAGLLHTVRPFQLSRLKQKVNACLKRRPNYAFNDILALGLDTSSDHRWSIFLIERMVVPLVRSALTNNNYELVLTVETKLYKDFINKLEITKLFGKVYSVLIPVLEEGGVSARRQIKLKSPSALQTRKRKKIAFVVNVESMLAHTTVLLETLRVLKKSSQTQYEFSVVSLQGDHKEFRKAIRNLGVELTSFKDRTKKFAGQMFELEKYCYDFQICGVVWVSVPANMVFAFAMRIAPIQIWFTMKHHGLSSKYIDGYFTGGSLEKYKTVNGRRWRNLTASMNNLVDIGKRGEALKIRASDYSKFEKIVLSAGRSAKLNSPAFLESVVAILQKNKDTAFLWASRYQDPAIQRVFDVNHVADQCFFVGWVDTLLYVQMADVYLDSFPFPSGLVAMQAMAAGKPIVFYSSDDSLRTGVPGIIMSGLTSVDATLKHQLQSIFCSSNSNQENLFLLAKTPKEYESFTTRLLSDGQMRTHVGDASADFVRQFLSNDEAYEKSFLGHLSELFDETL